MASEALIFSAGSGKARGAQKLGDGKCFLTCLMLPLK